MKKHEFWFDIKNGIIGIEATIEKEMWKLVQDSLKEMDNKEDQLSVVHSAGDLAKAIEHLRKARSFLR